MSVDIELSLMPDYITLRCSGSCTNVSELNDVFRRAVALARDHARCKILILANEVSGELTTQDRYEGAAFLSEQVFRAPQWISAIAVVGQIRICA